MAHYAELNENNEVIYVAYLDNETITDENKNEVEQLGIDHLHFHHGVDRVWVRTSYNGNFRGHYAMIGDVYRQDLDLFTTPSTKQSPSWVLNIQNGFWESPLPVPELTEEQSTQGYYYAWNEDLYQQDNTMGWVLTQDN